MWWLPTLDIEENPSLNPILATKASKNQTATLKDINKWIKKTSYIKSENKSAVRRP